jgi:hypothetical protein
MQPDTGLLARIAANRCRVQGCERARMTDAAVCRDHMNDLYAGRLDRAVDGSFVPRRTFRAVDWTGRVAA